MSAIDTRNESYFEQRDGGHLNRRQREIMLALHSACARRDRDFTLQEISHLTKLPINIVSGRVCELKNFDPFPYLVESDRRRCSVTGKNVTPVKINRGQLSLFGRAA